MCSLHHNSQKAPLTSPTLDSQGSISRVTHDCRDQQAPTLVDLDAANHAARAVSSSTGRCLRECCPCCMSISANQPPHPLHYNRAMTRNRAIQSDQCARGFCAGAAHLWLDVHAYMSHVQNTCLACTIIIHVLFDTTGPCTACDLLHDQGRHIKSRSHPSHHTKDPYMSRTQSRVLCMFVAQLCIAVQQHAKGLGQVRFAASTCVLASASFVVSCCQQADALQRSPSLPSSS